MHHRTRGSLAAVAALAASACSDVPTDPAPTPPGARPSASAAAAQGGIAIPAMPELVGDIPEVRLSGGPANLPRDLGDEELVAAIRAGGGRAYVAFKPRGAAGTKQSGVVPAMSRADALAARAEIQARGARIVRTYPRSATVVAELPPALAPVLRRLPFVNYVEPVPATRVAAQEITWGATKVGAPTVWSTYNNRGEYATISFLDSGIDQTHYGYELPYADCYYDSVYFTSCFDDLGHGSHVIGIATAQSNADGVVGIAHAPARVLSFKVCNWRSECFEDAEVSALLWLEAYGNYPRHVISMSLGGPSVSTAFREVVTRLSNRGDLLVAAAGNNPNPWGFTGVMEPARLPEVMAVSGTLEDDSFASNHFCDSWRGPYVSSSNSGPDVEISAPFHARSTVLNGQYGVECGTSMATPVVSGTAALVWSQYPTWSAAQVRNRLTSTARDLGAVGRDALFGHGRVNAAAAAAPPPPTPTVSIVGPSKVRANAPCLWQASVSGGTPPYSYYWLKNGGYVGNGTEVTTSFSASGSLYLSISDAAGATAAVSKNITVSSTASVCYY